MKGGGRYKKVKTFLDGVSGIPTSIFHSFLRLLRTYMPMRAKREVHRLLGYLIGELCGVPPPHKIFSFNRQLPEYRTFAANSNHFSIQPVCNLLSTNEINPSENIFNNNVIQNGISKIVKSWRLNQFLLESGRLQPHYIDAGSIIYVDILPYNLAQKNCCYRPEMSIHQSSDLVGSRIL